MSSDCAPRASRRAPAILQEIVARKYIDVAKRKIARPLESYRTAGLSASTRSLADAIRSASGPGFILECKRRSPSAGELVQAYRPAKIAAAYAPHAAAISVLTDTPFFGGSFDDLRQVRDTVALPVLCKDFIIDPYQVYEARYHGADAVLLMLSVLRPDEVAACMAVARELSLDTLVEVHDDRELREAMALGADLIGINNRNLKTMKVALETTERLAHAVPRGPLVISESGIRDHRDVRRLGSLVDGFLVGSSLMASGNLGRSVREMIYGRVKVCGLTRPEDAGTAWEAGACFGGLIFAQASPRAVDEARARSLCSAEKNLAWAGVFVDADLDKVVGLVERLGLQVAQLHGDESSEYIRALRSKLPETCELWQAKHVGREALETIISPADRVLLEAYDARSRGGTGKSFDWSLLSGLAEREHIVLAGGLCAENAAHADALGVWALDVNSGVEERAGRKSTQKVQRFFRALRAGQKCARRDCDGI